jgi:hypothetical protein
MNFFASSASSHSQFYVQSTSHPTPFQTSPSLTLNTTYKKTMAAILRSNSKFLTRLHHLQGLNPIKAPSRSASHRFLSSSSTTPNANTNPSYPPFSLKKIIPNPRVRRMVWVGLGMLGCVEGFLWYFYPVLLFPWN